MIKREERITMSYLDPVRPHRPTYGDLISTEGPEVRVLIEAVHEGATVRVDADRLAELVALAVSGAGHPRAKVTISICAIHKNSRVIVK